MGFLHHNCLRFIWNNPNILVLIFENFVVCHILNWFLNRFWTNKRLATVTEVTWHHQQSFTVAWLSGRYNSPPLQEISSRDLIGSERGEGLVTNLVGPLILACSSWRGWSNTLMSSFLCFGSSWWSCRPSLGIFIVLTERIRGSFKRTDLYKVDYLVDNIEEGGGSYSRIES